MRRYGFHGINYAYIAQQLPALLGDAANGKIVVAHLGNGASLCILDNLKSVDTTMAYTPAGGIPMGTRSGDLDPGVMLALAEHYTTLAFLGFNLAHERNTRHAPQIHAADSKPVLIIPADEAAMICRLTGALLGSPPQLITVIKSSN